jgi:hypothetical protein
MNTLSQKKILLHPRHISLLRKHKKLGFGTQASLVRHALDEYIAHTEQQQIKKSMEKASKKLARDYRKKSQLTDFTDLNSEDFI